MLQQFQVSSGLDFWREASPGRPADILVSTENIDWVTEWLESNHIDSHIMINNVQQLIQETMPRNTSARGMFDWTDYYSHDDLNLFIQDLADTTNYTRIINIGKSYEGRDMNVLAIEKVI